LYEGRWSEGKKICGGEETLVTKGDAIRNSGLWRRFGIRRRPPFNSRSPEAQKKRLEKPRRAFGEGGESFMKLNPDLTIRATIVSPCGLGVSAKFDSDFPPAHIAR